MKIKNVTDMRSPAAAFPHMEESSAAPELSHSFDRQFQSKNREKYDAYMRELTDKIGRQGEQLVKRVDLAEFVRYRELVAELIAAVVSGSFRFYKESVYDMQGRRRVLATVDRINAKLEELAMEFLQGQKDQLRLIAQVDDIRGLVLDLVA